jgi:hypothetical protein
MMTSITIELEDHDAERLREEARRRSVPVEELITAGALAIIGETGGAARRDATDEEFNAALEYVLAKNAELYRRLA